MARCRDPGAARARERGNRSLARARGGDVEYRVDDLRVGAAPAEISRHPAHYLVLPGSRIRAKQRVGGHELPGRAEAALQGVVIDECLLEWVQLAGAGSHALDGPDDAALAGRCESETGIGGLAIELNRARAAFPATAGELRPGEPEPVAQHREEREMPRHFQLVPLVVDRQQHRLSRSDTRGPDALNSRRFPRSRPATRRSCTLGRTLYITCWHVRDRR